MSQQDEQHDAPPILTVHNLSVDFAPPGQTPVQAVRNVSFSLKPGEVMGLVGESGCGKSTLMLSLMRLLPPTGRIVSGEVLLQGRNLMAISEQEMAAVRWRNIAMIFQGAMNALNPVHTVGDQIAEALVMHTTLRDSAAVNARVLELLDLVGIAASRKNQYPHQYSGGMRQRAMIAMALACEPQVVIADEPTTALDVMIQAQILELLTTLRQRLGLAIIFVTHDLGVVAEVCDSVLVMYGGKLAEYADIDTIYNAPRHPYTQELLKAFPDVTKPGETLTAIPGYPPRLNPPPPGCRFAERCPAVFNGCRTEEPRPIRLGDGHVASCHLVAG